MKTNGNRSGFSMVEVLVASAILVVIVMMLAMLFQQTSLAWRTGVKRADGFMQIRAALGAIQRDASAAVDARYIPADLQNKLGGSEQTFKGSLKFYTLTGATPPGKNADIMRALTYVTYETDGTRTETILKADGTTEGGKPSNVLDFVKRASSKNRPMTNIQDIRAVFGDLDQNGLPLYVTVEARVTTAGYSLDIGAASAGPDKTWGTKDDIRTWSE